MGMAKSVEEWQSNDELDVPSYTSSPSYWPAGSYGSHGSYGGGIGPPLLPPSLAAGLPPYAPSPCGGGSLAYPQPRDPGAMALRGFGGAFPSPSSPGAPSLTAPALAAPQHHYAGLSGPSSVPAPLRQAVPTAALHADWQRAAFPAGAAHASHVAALPSYAAAGGGGGGSGVGLERALLIWDWDDTLMCSSAINANQLTLHQAQQLESLLEQVLTLSFRLGETCIVTNADELWVIESTRRFAPRVMPLLSQMRVISARRRWETTFPGDVFAWKRETFREVLAPRIAYPAPGASLNLVVLGDSPAEMEAAQTGLAGAQQPMAVKTVKFKETPTCDELLEQLMMVQLDLASIVSDDRSSCRNLVLRMRPSLQKQPLAYSPNGMASSPYPYGPPVLPVPYSPASSGYLGGPMIYATH